MPSEYNDISTHQSVFMPIAVDDHRLSLDTYAIALENAGVEVVTKPHLAYESPYDDEPKVRIIVKTEDLDNALFAMGTALDHLHSGEPIQAKRKDATETEQKRTVVVNMFGGPGSGKTTAALEVASKLKKAGYVVEYAPEVAKEFVWAARDESATAKERQEAREMLDGKPEHQALLYEKQMQRIRACVGQCDFVVTDSPPILGAVYLKEDYPWQREDFEALALREFNAMRNFNMIVKRDGKYEPEGRIHGESEAMAIDSAVKRLLDGNGIYHGEYSHSQIEKSIENMVKTHDRIAGHAQDISALKEQAHLAKAGAQRTPVADRGRGDAPERMAHMADEKTELKPYEVEISSKWLRTPFPATKQDGTPIQSKAGDQKYQAFLTIPPDTSIKGVDVGRYSVLVEYAWGEDGKAQMDKLLLAEEPMRFNLLKSMGKDEKVYLRPPIDQDGNKIGEPLRVEPNTLAAAVKKSTEEFVKNAREQRKAKEAPAKEAPAADAPAVPGPSKQRKEATPGKDQAAAARAAAAQAKVTPQHSKTQKK